jgi:RNA polymerase sigma-70 factor (ECF subfamily)
VYNGFINCSKLLPISGFIHFLAKKDMDMGQQLSNRELVLQLQDGCLEALGMLYNRHNLMVYRTALVISGDTEAASDILQDVFLRLHRYANNIDPLRPIEPWLHRMTVNFTYTWVRRNNRWLRSLEDLTELITGDNKDIPHVLTEKRDDWDQVQQAVLDLPLQQRVVVVLYYLNDLSLQEVADILDVPVGTIKSRLYYGRFALRRSLGMGRLTEKDGLPDLNYEGPGSV